MNKIITTAAILMCHSTLSVAETQLTISPSLLHFDYTEFSTTNEVLDRELGWLPGLEAKLNYAITPDWFINFHTSYYQGTVDYVGQTQSGAPHTTDTKTKLFRFGSRIEKVIYENAHLFVGAQSHQWQRDIRNNNNVSGIDETYQWLEYSIGLNSNILLSQNDVLNWEVGFLITRDATIDVDLSRVNLGSTTLDIGDGSGARASLSWHTRYKNNSSFGLGLFIEAWDFGRSNTKATQGGSSIVFVTEPKSETRNIGLRFNFKHLL